MSELIRIPPDFRIDHGLEGAIIDTSKCERAQPRRVRRRVVSDGRQTYTAYDAHSLLEQLSEFGHGRPGHFDE